MPIKIKNLDHNYSSIGSSDVYALRNINVSINDGEFIGIIGHTGSGKTTFVQHLNGLLLPSSGTVEVDGVETSNDKQSLKNIRKKVGLVFQYPENQLFEETIYKDIAFGPRNLGLDEKSIEKRVRESMELVHLDFEKYANKSPFEISGGQMRRVAIAGVIAMNPKYLVLDEPTAGLDPHGRDRILSMLAQLHKSGNITIIMVSHNMDEIARLASRIIIFSKGCIVADGTPKEVFSENNILKTTGLRVPQVMLLARKLKEKGYDIDESIYKQEDIKNELLRIFGRKHA
ncbi:MAG: energy-coupling factor transporter ATPase [Eubacteriales bacterium]|nr:energy-coupling factor transporter ATPase [Eubacteriales bacterium]